MAATVTALVNQALRRIGDERINDILDSDETAVVANELWPQTRDEVLSEHEWRVAMTRRALAELSIDNLTIYEYAYQLPTDPYCLRVLTLLDAAGGTYRELGAGAPWMVEGRVLYTDEKTAAIKYIARVTEVSQYDPLLTEAMALRLASKMAFKITQSKEVENDMYQKSLVAVEHAKQRDAEASDQGWATEVAPYQMGFGHPYYEGEYKRRWWS